MFLKAKLKEPEFTVLRFNGFKPMEFVESLKLARLAEFYFNIKLEWNPVLEFWNRQTPENIHKICHEDFLIITEENTFHIMTASQFYKTYKIIEENKN